MAIVIFLSFQLFSNYASKWHSINILLRGTLFIIIMYIISQSLFSSVMRMFYEIMFCSLAIANMILFNTFLKTQVSELTVFSPEYAELWDILKFITPICLGFPILLGGVGFINSFYQKEQDMVQLQLYRHIVMVIYFEIGSAVFLIYPVLKKILLIRGS